HGLYPRRRDQPGRDPDRLCALVRGDAVHHVFHDGLLSSRCRLDARPAANLLVGLRGSRLELSAADVRPMAEWEGRTVPPGPPAIPLSRGGSRFRRPGRERLAERPPWGLRCGGDWWGFRWGLRGSQRQASAGLYPNRRGDRGAALGLPRRLGG